MLRVRRSASRDLWQILCGHWTSVQLVVAANMLMCFVRALKYWTGRGLDLLTGPWPRRVAELLGDAGFVQGP